MIFDILVGVVCAFLGFLGWRKGLIRTLLQLIGLVFAIILASQFYALGARLVDKLLSLSDSLQAVVGYVLVFLAVYIFFILIAVMLSTLLKKLSLAWLDHGLGLLFGLCEGALIFCVIVWVLNVFPELKLTSRLEGRAVTYNCLRTIETKTIQVFELDAKLGQLRRDIRKIFLLPDDSPPQKSRPDIPQL